MIRFAANCSASSVAERLRATVAPTATRASLINTLQCALAYNTHAAGSLHAQLKPGGDSILPLLAACDAIAIDASSAYTVAEAPECLSEVSQQEVSMELMIPAPAEGLIFGFAAARMADGSNAVGAGLCLRLVQVAASVLEETVGEGVPSPRKLRANIGQASWRIESAKVFASGLGPSGAAPLQRTASALAGAAVTSSLFHSVHATLRSELSADLHIDSAVASLAASVVFRLLVTASEFCEDHLAPTAPPTDTSSPVAAMRVAAVNAAGADPVARLALPEDATLELITDVEGNWDYFCALISRSRCLRWTGGTLALADGAMLVFGGDACDRGPGDMRVTRALVQLHEAYPGRVFLLAGNRDVNKIRLTAELADGEWPDVDPVQYLDVHLSRAKVPYAAAPGCDRTQRSALGWILGQTMGARTQLVNRRCELEALGHDASDAAVRSSFVHLVAGRGGADGGSGGDGMRAWTLEYLRRSHVMLLLGDCLFMHGALTERSLLAIPSEDCYDGQIARERPARRLARTTSLDEWARMLNEWKDRQLALHEAFPTFSQLTTPDGCLERWRGGTALAMPSLSGCHVVTDGFLHPSGNLQPLAPVVEAYLAQQGVRRVFVGHKPFGESPGLIRAVSGNAPLMVLIADTSYSDEGAATRTSNPDDTRGIAITTVEVTTADTTTRGVLADGTEHGFRLRADLHDAAKGAPPATALLGVQGADGAWGHTLVGGRLRTCRGEGWNQYYELV